MRIRWENWDRWTCDYERKLCPELVPTIEAAFRAFKTIRRTKRPRRDLLNRIVKACLSPRVPLWTAGTTFLGRLTASFSEAREAVLRLLQDSRSHVRVHAVKSLAGSTPLSFKMKVLRAGLLDHSPRVRLSARP